MTVHSSLHAVEKEGKKKRTKESKKKGGEGNKNKLESDDACSSHKNEEPVACYVSAKLTIRA